MVKIWCLPLNLLDDKRLLGEHHELHVIFNVLTNNLKGFSHHPQTLRFKHNLGMLLYRHNQQIKELKNRGFNHYSPLKTKIKPKCYRYSKLEYIQDLTLLINRTVKSKVVNHE